MIDLKGFSYIGLYVFQSPCCCWRSSKSNNNYSLYIYKQLSLLFV